MQAQPTRRALATSLAASLALFALVVAPATRAHEDASKAHVSGVERVSLVVQDLPRARTLFRDVLGFMHAGEIEVGGAPLASLFALPGASYRASLFRVGGQRIALVRTSQPGRPIPSDSRSDDLWFQHLAIVVRDIDRAAARLARHGVETISRGGPQTIPLSNPAAGGIRALYFRDGERHPLELIWFPPGKGDPRWQEKHAALVLGIDHTAIAVRDTGRSEAFYRELGGLEVKGRSYNTGPEQEALSGVPGARVRITGLRGVSGPGVELLEYESPRAGRPAPADTRANDDWSSEIQLRVPSLERALEVAARHGTQIESQSSVRVEGARAVRLRDPDGHALRLVER